ncbi:enoyl-CoA hydratase PHS1 [Kluyveromyces lactis]|uniref:Very-long-chain (3R)-3-hydroxyacyl-CoA dehydratase n=1 Tax=Kluyveromyces lactis (strain ATCC 8585 / CBS 2359 / DSM 70799 / NBRC 1267 / NRRL Y-1140 / WM37) TaxID=284590 RepID=Q6CK24_KLULA|nr:uncharacterized protein KLLA0_F14146g [Kluyveromyces lactis]CAG98423.1 KLLA0F14146p [Kluyveromyces lactis]|eukprot:XP_455715.1 uncharacterized protein KLLA0_F14146g [Kluyveromyces lactis]
MASSKASIFSFLPLYNLLSASAWAYVLYQVVTLYPKIGQPSFFIATKDLVTYVQCGAIIEVTNSLFGIVRAPLVTTAAQVASRLLVVIGIFQYVPEAENAHKIYYITLLSAWCIAEIVRYMFYFFNLVAQAPTVLVVLRYNMFYVLYPLGVGSELFIIYSALPLAEAKYNILYKYFLIAGMLAYIPGFPVLFSHMVAQRRKVMRSLNGDKRKSA